MSSGIYNKLTGYHNRRTIRLREYDYSQSGAYFVTICIHDRKQNLFGDVVNGEMIENDNGNAVRNCWNHLPSHYPQIRLDEFVIMPNHMHGIIIIRDLETGVGARLSRPVSIPHDVDVGARSSRPTS
jgi:putative transposase